MAKNRTRRFDWVSGIVAACAGLAVSASAHAQVTFNEVEPNDNKAGAQVIAGMAPGDNITGNTIGTSTTVAGAASADNFRITTTAAPAPGVYRYRLVITTAGAAGHVGTIRGLTQTAGVPNAGTDATLQTSSTATTPARFVQWYANGNPSQIIFRVTGVAATTGNYVATLERTPVTPIAGPSAVVGGNVTISSIGQTTTDTDFWVYDSNFNPIPGFGCDDESVAGGGTGTTLQGISTRTLAAGTYFVAIANFNVANNQGSPADDDFRTGAVMDFPNALANSTTTANLDVDFTITGGDLTVSNVTATRVGAFDVAIAQFSVVPPSSPTNPTGTATATPATVVNNGTGTSTIAVTVVPGQTPTSTAHTVTITDANLVGSPISLLDNGVAPDAVAGDNIFTRTVTVVNGTATGTLPLSAAIQETAPLARSGSANVNLNVVLPPPANDLCANAATVAVGSPAATADNTSATSTGETVTCTTISKGIWYDFTNGPTSGSFTLDTEGSSQADTVLAVFSACGGTQLACDDDTGTGNLSSLLLSLAPNQNVKILVGSFGSGATGGGLVLNIAPAIAGACCNDTTGACTLVTTSSCAAGLTYQGDGSVCSPSPCPASGACCNDASGACSVTVQTACPSGSTWQGAATVCTPNPCPQPPAPANNECASAISLTVGAAPIAGTNVASTPSMTTLPTCTGSTLDVWYSFNAPAAGTYQATVDADTGILYSISAFTACSTDGATAIACQGALVDPALLTITVTTPGVHFLRVASFTPASTFVVSVATVTSGACCNDTTGACTIVLTGVCPSGATYQGDNSVCTPSPCPASGACCNAASGACTITVQTACTSGSTWQGAATVCTPNPCPQPPPPANDVCSSASALSLNVAFVGSNAQATGDGTEGPGGACYLTSPTNFSKSVWFTFTPPVSDVYGITACGSSFDTVVSIFDGTCAAFGAELGCDDDTCDGITPPGSGLASIIAPVALTGGQTYLIRLAVFTAVGATPTGGAFTLTVTGNPVLPTGVCCRGSTCNATIAQAACTTSGTQFGASFNSTATACSATSATAPCCHADYDKTAGVQVADIFAYLNDWFASNTFADFGGDGTGTTPDVNDIFSFLNAWFAGGC